MHVSYSIHNKTPSTVRNFVLWKSYILRQKSANFYTKDISASRIFLRESSFFSPFFLMCSSLLENRQWCSTVTFYWSCAILRTSCLDKLVVYILLDRDKKLRVTAFHPPLFTSPFFLPAFALPQMVTRLNIHEKPLIRFAPSQKPHFASSPIEWRVCQRSQNNCRWHEINVTI